MAEPIRGRQDAETDIKPDLGLRAIQGGNQDKNSNDINNTNNNEFPGHEGLKPLLKSNPNFKSKYDDDFEPPYNGSTKDLNEMENNPDKTWEDNTAPREYKNSKGKTPKGMNVLRKKGPAAAIIGMVALIGSIIAIISSPGALLFSLRANLVGALSFHAYGMHTRTDKVLGYKFMRTSNRIKNGFVFSSDGTCSIKCKFGSVSKGLVANLEARGFDVKTQPVATDGLFKNRLLIETLKPPGGGPTIETGADWKRLMRTDFKSRFEINRIVRYKTMYFMNTKFGVMLKQKFNIDKLSRLSSKLTDKAKTKTQAVKDSMRKALGLKDVKVDVSPRAKLEADAKLAKTMKVVNGLSVKVDKAASTVQWICTGYGLTKSTNFAIKMAKYATFTAFAIMILTEIDKIKAGDADPYVVERLGEQFTALDNDGKASTDSAGYQMAAYGDPIKLSKADEKYSLKPNSPWVNLLNTLASTIPIAGTVLSVAAYRSICKIGGSVLTDIAVLCGPKVVEALGAAALTIEAGGVGALIPIGLCLFEVITPQAIVGALLAVAIPQAIKAIANHDLPEVNENTTGPPLGNVTYGGTAEALGGSAETYGLTAAKEKKQIDQYAIDTAEIKRQEDEIAIYEAKSTPFDIYNQYSFLGSIAANLHLESFYGASSPATFMKNVFNLVPKSLASLNNTVNATSEIKPDAFFNQCDDPSLQQIGINAADAFCNPYYVMESAALDIDPEMALDYMLQTKQIDENTGEAMPDTNYEKYMNNCANREGPLGDTAASIESDDYEWEVGLYCVDNPDTVEATFFSAYTADFAAMETLDDDAMYTPTAMEYKDKGIAFYEADDYASNVAKELIKMNLQSDQITKRPTINIASNEKFMLKQKNTPKDCKVGIFSDSIIGQNFLCNYPYIAPFKNQEYAI